MWFSWTLRSLSLLTVLVVAGNSLWLKHDPRHAALMGLACALPGVLGWVAAHLTEKTRVIDIPRRADGEPAPAIDRDTRFSADRWALAEQTIRAEWARVLRMARHADLHAWIWGFLGTLAIGISGVIWTTHDRVRIAEATASAAAISSLLSFANVLVRSAAHDASSRLFSCASRDLLTSVVVGVIASFLYVSTRGSGPDPHDATPIVIGLTAGLFGPRALEPLKERAGSVLGVKITADAPQQLSLAMIDGLNEEVALRLAEEGIDSVHALAFTSAPRLYFSTPFPWERIADWQAQAVLLEELGLARFARFKEQFPIRSVQEALDMLDDPETLKAVAQQTQVPNLDTVAKALRASLPLQMLALYSTYGDWLVAEILASGDVDNLVPASTASPAARAQSETRMRPAAVEQRAS